MNGKISLFYVEQPAFLEYGGPAYWFYSKGKIGKIPEYGELERKERLGKIRERAEEVLGGGGIVVANWGIASLALPFPAGTIGCIFSDYRGVLEELGESPLEGRAEFAGAHMWALPEKGGNELVLGCVSDSARAFLKGKRSEFESRTFAGTVPFLPGKTRAKNTPKLGGGLLLFPNRAGRESWPILRTGSCQLDNVLFGDNQKVPD